MNYNLLYSIIFVENKNKRQKWSGGRDRKTFFDYYQAILQHQIGKIGHQFQTCDIKSAFCKAAPPSDSQ